MSKLVWDEVGKKVYETGTSHGVMYPQAASGTYEGGEAWNGLTGVTDSPSGAEPTKLYANNGVYVTMYSAEENGGTITSYTYPDGFKACNGEAELATGVTIGQQDRKAFGLSYRTLLGNDTEGESHGYKLHLVYGCRVSPAEKAYSTVNDSPEAVEMSWEYTTTPVNVTDAKPTATVEIDSTLADPTCLAKLEGILYGSEEEDPRLPLPDEVKTIMTPAGVGG